MTFIFEVSDLIFCIQKGNLLVQSDSNGEAVVGVNNFGLSMETVGGEIELSEISPKVVASSNESKPVEHSTAKEKEEEVIRIELSTNEFLNFITAPVSDITG